MPRLHWQYLCTVLQIVAIAAGVASAYYWFESAKIELPNKFLFTVSRADPLTVNPGEIGFVGTSRGLTELGQKLTEQSKLSGRAAICAAISILLQAASMLTALIAANKARVSKPDSQN